MIARVVAYLTLMTQAVGRGAVARMIGLQLVIAVMEGAGLTLLAPILQSLSGRNDLVVPGLGIRVTVPLAFTLVLIVIAIRALAQWRGAVRSVEIRLATIDALRLGLIDDLYAADWRYVARQRRSVVVQRLTTEMERAQSALTTLISLIVVGLILLSTVAVAIVLTPVLGGVTALILLLVAALARRSVRSSVALGQTMNDRTETFGAAVTDSLASIRLMRAHDASAAWTSIVADEARRFREVRRSFVQKSSGVGAALGVVVVVAVLGLIAVGRATGLSFAALAALTVVATRILGAAQAFIASAQQFANDSSALDRLAEFGRDAARHRELAPALLSSGPGPVTTSSAPILSLRGLTVRYGDDLEPVLNSVDLDVPRGGLVTVTGASGSGKSTLLDVVLGLLRPDAGEMLVDGAELSDLAAWRARLGYVPQQTVLVPGSIRRNLSWSLPPGRTADDDAMWRALAGAGLTEVVARLPGGLEADLHENVELSGGEQQRLSIARALLREPELLLLDEATSALDPDTEERVLRHLLDGSRAVVLVTHRVSEFARRRTDVALRVEAGLLQHA